MAHQSDRWADGLLRFCHCPYFQMPLLRGNSGIALLQLGADCRYGGAFGVGVRSQGP